MNERTKFEISRSTNNTIRLALFVLLAIACDKWWVVLFVLIFWTTAEKENKNKEP